MKKIEIEKDKRFYVSELESEECQCGKPKKSGYSFCYGCYSSLPFEMQQALWKRIGQGYEEAYEEAVQFLISD